MPVFPVHFRLLAELPLQVVFKSRSYTLAIAELPVAGEWQLQAGWSGGYWLLAHAGSEAALRVDLYVTGLEAEPATVGRTIFDRLVAEGRAEQVR